MYCVCLRTRTKERERASDFWRDVRLFRGSLAAFSNFLFPLFKLFSTRAEFFQRSSFSRVTPFFFPSSDLSSLRFTLVVVVFPVYIYCGCCFDHHDWHGGAKVVFEFPTRRIRSNTRRNNNNNNNNNTEEKEDGDFKTLHWEFTSSKISGRVYSHPVSYTHLTLPTIYSV